jgi:transposase
MESTALKHLRREHRPDLNQVMLELMVEHQAEIPILMTPLRGNSSDPHTFGQVIRAHVDQLHTTYGATYVVADSALYSEDNLDKLAQTAIKWIPRVPAPLSEAQAALVQAEPQAMAALHEGYRSHALTSTYGGVEPRWVRIDSEPRQAPAPRTVDTPRRKQSDKEGQTFKKLCSTTFACEADARQALSAFEQGLQATFLTTSTVRVQPCYGKRGRPGRDAQPDPVVYQIEGALASSITARQALVDQHSCVILATNERDDTQLPPQEVWQGDKGQVQSERGFRFLKDPQCFASSLSLKKPERIMALLMVMTVCLLVYAALEYRIRQELNNHEATFPDQRGNGFNIRRHAGCFSILWGSTCCVRQANGRLSSTSPRSISTCFASLGHPTYGFMTSDIHKNHEGGAECRLQRQEPPNTIEMTSLGKNLAELYERFDKAKQVDFTEAIKQKEAELFDKQQLLASVEDNIQDLLNPDTTKQRFESTVSMVFAALVGTVICGFFAVAFHDERVRQAIFSGQAGMQFVTLFSLVIAIILFGITSILEAKELAALLGGLSGYILGRVTAERPPVTTLGIAPHPTSPASGATSPVPAQP